MNASFAQESLTLAMFYKDFKIHALGLAAVLTNLIYFLFFMFLANKWNSSILS